MTQARAGRRLRVASGPLMRPSGGPAALPRLVTRRATPVNRGWRPTGQVMVRSYERVVPFVSNIAGMRLEAPAPRRAGRSVQP